MFCNVAILINMIYVYYYFPQYLLLAHEDTKNANIHHLITEKIELILINR